jgi:hypothetical protein
MSCTAMTADVDTGTFRPGGVVTVTVTCTADLSGLALSGLPGAATISATGRAPRETLRQISLGFSNSEASTVANPRAGGAG